MASAGDDKNRVISLSEVEKNNLSDPNGNCWIVLRGKVYDVTTFLTEHPGGEEVIKEHAGKDATDAFDDVGHSKDALQMTDDYQIGVLAETDKNKPGTKTGKNAVGDVPGDSWKDIVFSPTWTNFFIPAAIGIAVYVIYKGATRLFAAFLLASILFSNVFVNVASQLFMEKIGRYCLELKKTLDVEDPDSDKARAFRKKILKLLLEFEQTSDDQKGLELFWRVAYRDPVQTIKRRKVDTKYSSKIITEFINELRNQMKTGTKHAAVFSLYIGDLHRYMNSNQALIRAFYKKAISIDPDLGHAFNQLALTDTHIMSLRHWMMALTVEKPFALALQNVEKTLKEKFDDPMEERVAELVKLTTIQYKKIELQRHSELWTEALEDVENLESHPQLPLLLNVFSMSAMLSPSQMGYDVFLGATQLLCETFRCLLQKIQCAVEVDSDINVHRARRRRRRESGDDENESSGDEEGEGKNDEDAKGQKEENNKMDMKKNLEMLLLATACEWMYYADDVLNNGLEKSGTPIPSAFRDLYDDVVSILMDKLNGLLDTIKKYEEDVDEELSWLIYGPILESNNPKSPRPLRQLIYWAYQLTSQTESPIQFRDYFKKRDKSSKQANGRENIAQKMAELHIRQKQATSLEWLPVYVIYDTSVLEKHSNLARDLIFSRHFISVLPSFVLSIIDKMKTSNETIRSTLRLIERAQKRDRLQIVKANAHEECAKELIASANEHGLTSHETLVALLVEDLDKFQHFKIPSMVIYQIEGFHDRFHKAVSSRASVGVS